MHGTDQVTRERRGQLAAILVLCLLSTTAGQTWAAPCGSAPGDDAAIAATRELIASGCDCAGASTHGSYVQCARQTVLAAVSSGNLSHSCASQILGCARKSTCGTPNAVVCCRTSANGHTHSSVARSADHCVAPPSGNACVGSYSSACDACVASGCAPPPTPAPRTPPPTNPPATLPPRPSFCSAQVGLPALARVPFTTTRGASYCGGPKLSPPTLPPYTGQVADAKDNAIAYLGAGCLYAGALPAAPIPDGATSILDVVGISGTSLTLAGSAGDGPSNCTLGAGPGRHCSNGAPGTDALGACNTDADCGHKLGSCNFDANCYFGPPVPVPNSIFSACAVSVFLTDMCGAADLATNETQAATVLSSRLYLTGDAKSPCPRCIDGACSAGKNVGRSCTPVGSFLTSVDCPPDDSKFLSTMTVVLSNLNTGTSTLVADDNGMFCPNQTIPGALGIDSVRKVVEMGAPIGSSSSNLQSQTLAGTFCLSATGNSLVDALGDFPTAGALSAPGVIDLSGVLPLLP